MNFHALEFKQFAGLIAAYVIMVEAAIKQDYCYATAANLVETEVDHARYAGEKIARLFGGFCLRQRHEVAAAFLAELGIHLAPPAVDENGPQ